MNRGQGLLCPGGTPLDPSGKRCDPGFGAGGALLETRHVYLGWTRQQQGHDDCRQMRAVQCDLEDPISQGQAGPGLQPELEGQHG